jgi:hypothetical protein
MIGGKVDRKLLDRIFDFSLFVFGGASIALVGLGYVFAGAVAGLLSEPGFFWASYKSKMWSMWVLSGWWTLWWAVTAYRTF